MRENSLTLNVLVNCSLSFVTSLLRKHACHSNRGYGRNRKVFSHANQKKFFALIASSQQKARGRRESLWREGESQVAAEGVK